MSHNSDGVVKSTALSVPKARLQMPIRRPFVPMRPDETQIAALCVSGRSIYHHLPGVDAFDSRRDARTFKGRCPVVAHPPCRTWSKYLRQFAKPLDLKAEQDLARWCVATVIENGGVLEQPAGSHLWADQNLPMPNRAPRNPFLYSIYVEQGWFGNPSDKPTWLLISGVPRRHLPPMPYNLAERGSMTGLSQAARSRTMSAFAEWLCQVARLSWWQHGRKTEGQDSGGVNQSRSYPILARRFS